MGALAAGTIVVLPFPFSDLSASKRRPAVVLAPAQNGDWICCMVTSNAYADPVAVTLPANAFAAGSLNRASYARPSRLFTAHESLLSNVGRLTEEKFNEVRDAVVKVIRP